MAWRCSPRNNRRFPESLRSTDLMVETYAYNKVFTGYCQDSLQTAKLSRGVSGDFYLIDPMGFTFALKVHLTEGGEGPGRLPASGQGFDQVIGDNHLPGAGQT